MAVQKLKALVLEPHFSTRRTIVSMLQNIGSVDIEESPDFQELINGPKKLAYDIVFLNVELDPSITGLEFIRLLNRNDRVNRWCKFVLLTKNSDYVPVTSAHRYLKTELITLPTTIATFKDVLKSTMLSLKLFKSLIQDMYNLHPTELVEKLKTIKFPPLPDLQKDELTHIKINILLRGRKINHAYQLTDKVVDEHEKLREKLYLTSYTGDLEKFSPLIQTEPATPQLLHTLVYYRSFYYLMKRSHDHAYDAFCAINPKSMNPNELEVLAYLMILKGESSAAFTLLAEKLKVSKSNAILKTQIELSMLKCFCLQTLENRTIEDADKIFNELNDISIINEQEFKVRKDVNKLFLQLGILVLKDDKSATGLMNQLMKTVKSFDISQLNIMLMGANLLKLEDESFVIHLEIEKRFAKIEMSPEFLSASILHSSILLNTIGKEKLQARLNRLAEKHWRERRYFRALAKYRELINWELDSPEINTQFKKLLSDVGLNSYWSFESVS